MTGGACGVVVAGVRVGTDGMGTARPAQVRCLTGRAADALGGAGANGRPGRGSCRCAARGGAAGVPGAGVRGAAGAVGVRGGAGSGRAGRGDRAGPAAAGALRGGRGVAGAAARSDAAAQAVGGGGELGGGIGRVRPRRALCAGCGVSRVLLPDSMLRRRQYGVEVIWAGLLAAARGRPWNQVAAELGVPYTTVREWLRRFARRADRVHAWLCGLLPRLVDDPVLPPGTAGAAGDVLAVLGALHQQMPGRWPLVAGLSPGQLAARLSRCGLLAPCWPPGMINTSSPVT